MEELRAFAGSTRAYEQMQTLQEVDEEEPTSKTEVKSEKVKNEVLSTFGEQQRTQKSKHKRRDSSHFVGSGTMLKDLRARSEPALDVPSPPLYRRSRSAEKMLVVTKQALVASAARAEEGASEMLQPPPAFRAPPKYPELPTFEQAMEDKRRAKEQLQVLPRARGSTLVLRERVSPLTLLAFEASASATVQEHMKSIGMSEKEASFMEHILCKGFTHDAKIAVVEGNLTLTLDGRAGKNWSQVYHRFTQAQVNSLFSIFVVHSTENHSPETGYSAFFKLVINHRENRLKHFRNTLPAKLKESRNSESFVRRSRSASFSEARSRDAALTAMHETARASALSKEGDEINTDQRRSRSMSFSESGGRNSFVLDQAKRARDQVLAKLKASSRASAEKTKKEQEEMLPSSLALDAIESDFTPRERSHNIRDGRLRDRERVEFAKSAFNPE